MSSEQYPEFVGLHLREATRRDWGALVRMFAQAAATDSMFIGLGRSETQRSRFLGLPRLWLTSDL